MKSFVRKSNSQKVFWNIFIMLFIVLAGVGVVFYSSTLKHTRSAAFYNIDGSKALMDVSAFEKIKFLNIAAGTNENLQFEKADYSLLILLSAGDCPNCLDEREIWSEFIKKYDSQKLQVIGVLTKTSLQESKTFTKAFNFPFPIFLDEGNQLSQATQLPPLTPYKVLLKNGEVILADGPNANVEAQKSFGEKVNGILNN
jgi:peroxiredoxin